MLKKIKIFTTMMIVASSVASLPMSAFAWDTPLVNGAVYSIKSQLSGKAIDLLDGAPYDGAKIVQWDVWYGSNQLWKAVYQGNGFYKFVNYNSGKVLEVPGGNYSQGTRLQQWGWNDSLGQQWGLSFQEMSSSGRDAYYSIHNRMTDQVIDVGGYSNDNGAWIIQWPWIKEQNQKWMFTRRY